jgi:hypothetical protein
MLDRYSHIRTRAKEQAIAALHASQPQILAAMGTEIGTISSEAEKQEKLNH